MMPDERLALFVLLAQTVEKQIDQIPSVAPSQSLNISEAVDLAVLMPEEVRRAINNSEGYKLFFIFEGYLRDLVREVLTKDTSVDWWEKVPGNVKDEVALLEETEEAKIWMELRPRDKLSLMTYPQLLTVMHHRWKEDFEDVIRDKGLIQEARLITHLRNVIGHMADISPEEMERVRQTMRDWFRMVPP